MLRRLKGVALLDGYRSQEPLDIVAIAEAVSALSRLISNRPDILEIDVNPFIAYPDGAVAVDALVRLDGSRSPIFPKTS
ncbi:MAG: acetate--CoA ligase family protein [Desulfobacterales bacterium]|nr:acetate--CoA ligase family protein [Desulfobacterales bacterium]